MRSGGRTNARALKGPGVSVPGCWGGAAGAPGAGDATHAGSGQIFTPRLNVRTRTLATPELWARYPGRQGFGHQRRALGLHPGSGLWLSITGGRFWPLLPSGAGPPAPRAGHRRRRRRELATGAATAASWPPAPPPACQITAPVMNCSV